MSRITALSAIVLSVALSLSAQTSADDVARLAYDVLGGHSWAQARYFSFTFKVETGGQITSSFPQRWDRVTGNYRVSGNDPHGQPFEIVMNTKTKAGRATLNGAPVTDPIRLADLIANLGYVRYTNDTFWLRMPFSMMESAVHRTYEGERNDSCGHVWDVLKLTFDEGGLRPGDTYWAWINRNTRMVEEWDMRLATMKPQDRTMEVVLGDYRRVGDFLLPLRRDVRDRGQIVRIENLQILPAPPRGAFD